MMLLTEKRIEELFEGTDFGPASKTDEGRKKLMAMCLFKKVAGYGNGRTIRQICIEAGLLTKKENPTKDGLRWAYNIVLSNNSARSDGGTKKIEKVKQFLNKNAYTGLPVLIDDCQPIKCLFCQAEGWMPEDINHEKDCELGELLDVLK